MAVAWVTGAAGFIGGHVTTLLRARGWSVVGIDRRGAPTAEHIVAAVGPAAFAAALKIHGPPRLVFHGAGTGLVGEASQDPHGALQDTVASTETLLDFLSARAPEAHFVLPSSAAVYGDAEAETLSEDIAPNPISPYGRYKRAAETACARAAEKGLRIAVLRLFSIYGPGLTKQLPWELGRKLLTAEGPVELFGTGAETRDFLHVHDVAALVLHLADAAVPPFLVINGGTGHATRIDAFAAMLRESLGVRHAVRFNHQVRTGDPVHYRADVRKLSALGFRPRMELRAGVADYAAWLKGAPA